MMAAIDKNCTTMVRHLRLNKFRKIVIFSSVFSTCMVVTFSPILWSQDYISRPVGYLHLSEKIFSQGAPHKSATPTRTASQARSQKSRSSFVSSFVVQENEVTQEDRAAVGADRETSTTSLRTRTFAVIIHCEEKGPFCFERDRHSVASCPYSRCRQTSHLERADVVLVYVYRMDSEEFIPKFRRPANQRWVMWSPEAASRKNNFHMLDFPSLRGQFNWTMTYRLDSDIVALYGRLQRRPLPDRNYEQIYRGKRFLVAWFVSHCQANSRREIYVQRMQKVVDVHIFGSCGTYNCSAGANKRGNDSQVCLPMLSKSYHFYLAFENSMCKDYVTEKFFKLFHDVDIIPVVRGGADYKRLFPPGTFIDASDYKSPEDLSEFLQDLSRSSSRYVSMLKEKSRYSYARPKNIFCDLCEKMMTDSSTKWYPDVRTWFTKDQCYKPKGL